jgi:hypothetical protein
MRLWYNVGLAIGSPTEADSLHLVSNGVEQGLQFDIFNTTTEKVICSASKLPSVVVFEPLQMTHY